MESLDPCISVPLRWEIGRGGNRTTAVRNVGFRGWRRNRAQLRDDDAGSESSGGGVR